MKSLEVSEQEAKQREENFADLMREYTAELKEVTFKQHVLLSYIHYISLRLLFPSKKDRRKS